MELKHRRVHIAGSANLNCDPVKLKYGHELIALLSSTLLKRDVSLCAQVGKEPMHSMEQNTSTIFDWTIIRCVCEYIEGPTYALRKTDILPFTTVTTEKTVTHIPDTRTALWQTLVGKTCVDILSHPQHWTAGAIRRNRIAAVGDILFLVSGGEGVEHLAQLYLAQRKPVVAFDLDLGASTEPGIGRSVAINKVIASNPELYLSVKKAETIGALWANISAHDGTRPIQDVVQGVLSLLEALAPPTAFCVRLLNPTSTNFQDVDDFFARIVNPVVQEMDYKLVVSPQSPNESRWMNEQIFRGIHDSELVIVDLTDERPNCLIELGYALGRDRRLLVCAKEGTKLPFDIDKIECFFWSPTIGQDKTDSSFREFVKRNMIQAPLVPMITLF
ncbi:MAG: hypothetical protein ABI947_22870 [Chloroflexota bacterium]